MSICNECWGKGWIKKQGVQFDCRKCKGTGVIENEPQTNEEWLKSLDTEGLVDYLFEVHKGGSSVERQRWIEEHKERIKMQYRVWLKQPHTKE